MYQIDYHKCTIIILLNFKCVIKSFQMFHSIQGLSGNSLPRKGEINNPKETFFYLERYSRKEHFNSSYLFYFSQ
jgi:hypothetical protein